MRPLSPAGPTKRATRKDRWLAAYSQATKDYEALLQRAAELEVENDALRVKEGLLLQVAGLLQGLVAGVTASVAEHGPPARHATAGATPAALQPDQQASGTPNQQQQLIWSAVMSAVQQHEQDIKALCGRSLDGMHPSCQQQSQAVRTLAAVCSKEIMHQVSTLSGQQLTARLADLQARIALHVVRTGQPTGDDPADTSSSSCSSAQELRAALTEFEALLMGAMVWDMGLFRDVLNRSMDTQQPLAENLPAAHWLNAFRQLRLSEQQVACLSCTHSAFTALRTRLYSQVQRNAAQQAAHTESLAALLQQTGLTDSTTSRTTPQPPAAAPGLGCAAAGPFSHAPAMPAASASRRAADRAAGDTPAATGAGQAAGAPHTSPAAAAAAAGTQGATAATAMVPAGGSSSSSGQARMDPGPSVQAVPLDEAAAAAAPAALQAGCGSGGECVSLEELLAEQSVLLHKVLLLAVRVGIMTSCTLTEYQQAIFVAVSYPSIPRIDQMMSAYQQHQEQLQQEQQDDLLLCSTRGTSGQQAL